VTKEEYDFRKDAFGSFNVAIDALRNTHGTSRRIELPFPPSVNKLFFNAPGKGRVKTPAYHAWQDEALREIMYQRIKPVEGEVSISIGLVAPDKRARDCDNLIKAPLDTMVKAKIIKDDRSNIVRKVSVEWLASGPPCVVLIHQINEVAS